MCTVVLVLRMVVGRCTRETPGVEVVVKYQENARWRSALTSKELGCISVQCPENQRLYVYCYFIAASKLSCLLSVSCWLIRVCIRISCLSISLQGSSGVEGALTCSLLMKSHFPLQIDGAKQSVKLGASVAVRIIALCVCE